MPNWCHNTLTVEGDAEELARFVEAVRENVDDGVLRAEFDGMMFIPPGDKPLFEKWAVGRRERRQPLSFETLVPTPAGNGDDWYAHHVGMWGTKWDARFNGQAVAALSVPDNHADVDKSSEALGVTVTPTVAIYKFDTAWSPPLPWVNAASSQFPELEFLLRFGEVGNDVAGEVKFVGGVLIESEELEVADVLAPEEMWF